ncbi:MAG: hypothetical protein ABW185_11535 [Sedimenticola sp.]
MTGCVLPSTATISLNTLEVCESSDDKPEALFSVAAPKTTTTTNTTKTENGIPVTEYWDEEIRRNRPGPNFFFQRSFPRDGSWSELWVQVLQRPWQPRSAYRNAAVYPSNNNGHFQGQYTYSRNKHLSCLKIKSLSRGYIS